MLLTAPAGRGKTALLVRWLTQIDREIWPVAFVPISIRYETNRAPTFYYALAARLAEILGERLATTPADPASFYRDKVIEYLDAFRERGRHCLVVIDGLDEAAGWQVDTSVLPLHTAPGVKIVASARVLAGQTGPVDWLRDIGWTTGSVATIHVPPLDRNGIADVLRKMGVPLADLTGDVDVLSELARLTTGDPLLVSLYVEELWENRQSTQGLRPEDLRSMDPGYAAFLKRWWGEQRRVWQDAGAVIDADLTQAILAVLACALGPLRFVELEQLIREAHAVDSVFSVDSLRPIERLVVGDGRAVGYSLSHPKLAEYFRNEHFRGGEAIRRTRAAIIGWGRSTVKALNGGTLKPSSDPPYAYLLNHYSQHWSASAEATSDPQERAEALVELVSEGWRNAWEAYEGGLQGFASDVRTAWDAVRHVRSSTDRQSIISNLAVEIRCALCLSSICSMGSNIPDDLLALAVACDAMTIQQAQHVADLKGGEPENRVQALVTLAPYLPETKKIGLIEEIRALSDEGNRARALIKLAGYLPADVERRSLVTEVRAIAVQSQRPETAASILGLLLPSLSHDEDRVAWASEALAAAEQVADSYTRAMLLADIAPYLSPEQGSSAYAQASDAASSTAGPERSATALVNLAVRLAEQDPQRSKLCQDAIGAADKMLKQLNATGSHREFYIDVAIKAKACALALLARSEPDGQRRVELLELAESSARSAPPGYHRVNTLTSVAPHLPEPRRAAILEEALGLARTLPTGNNRTHCLGALAALFHRDRQREIVLEALRAARLIEDEYGRFLTFMRIAGQAETGVSLAAVERATALLHSGIMDARRADALGRLAPFLAPSGQQKALAEALAIAMHSPNAEFRTSAVINLIPQLPQDLQATAVRHVLDDNSRDMFREMHLIQLLDAVPNGLRAYVLTKTVHELEPSASRFRDAVFPGLARHLQGEHKQHIIREYKLWIDTLDKASDKARHFARLAQMTQNGDERDEVLRRLNEEIQALVDKDEKSTVLSDVLATLSGDLGLRFLREAYEAAKACTSHITKAYNLAKIAPYLDRRESVEAAALSLSAAKGLDQAMARFNALKAAVPFLEEAQRLGALDLLLDSCAHLKRSHAMTVLGDLPAILPKEDHATVLLPAMAALDEVTEWFP